MSKKHAFLGLIGFVFLLSSCNVSTSPLSSQCQVNTTDLMPSNRVPPGTQMQRGAYSGNVTEGIDFLTLNTELSPIELLEHYNNQILEQRTDWSLIDSESTPAVAWSSWSVMDKCGESWDGLITITKPPSVSDPFVTIRIKKHD